MESVVIALTNEKDFLGYSSSIVSMIADIPNEKHLFDINNFNQQDFEAVVKAAAKKHRPVKLLSSVAFGADFIKDMAYKNENLTKAERDTLSTVLTGDRFYDIDIKGFKNLTLIMPNEALSIYAKRYPYEHFGKKSADLVACVSADEINKRADDYARLNPQIADKLSSLLKNDGSGCFFVGGRVALSDGSIKENNPDIFQKAACDFADENLSGAVVFHGLHSFTKGDKSNDFSSAEAFYQGIRKNLKNGGEFLLLTKTLDSCGKRVSCLKEIKKINNEVREQNYPINESAFGAAEYYWLLREASAYNLPLKATTEQMNFIPEALELGNTPDKFSPYDWALQTDANATAYHKLFEAYKGNKTILKNAKQAFEAFIKNDRINSNLMLKIGRDY